MGAMLPTWCIDSSWHESRVGAQRPGVAGAWGSCSGHAGVLPEVRDNGAYGDSYPPSLPDADMREDRRSW
jgi:hypothetical protein